MQTKPIWQSKTVWFNLITFLLAGADALAGTGVITPEYLVVITTLGNLALRMLTTTAVTVKNETPEDLLKEL